MSRIPAPICLFVFKRPETLKRTIASLLQNPVAKETDLYIFSDGARKGVAKEELQVMQVRQIVKDIQGFRSVQLHFASDNQGLANSIIKGVSTVIDKEGKVIVLEDDLVVSPNFLSFMNQALEAYSHNPLIFSISGYSIPITTAGDTDVYFTKRASSWGWATWKDRWTVIDWQVTDYGDFLLSRSLQKNFNKMGSDLSSMLKKQMNHKINSWAIRWTYHQFRKDLLTVFPRVSKVSNEGFSEGATHTSPMNRTRFSTVLDASSKTTFVFPDKAVLHSGIIREFTRPYSLPVRVLYKIKGLL